MKFKHIVLFGFLFVVMSGCTTALKMPPPDAIEMKNVKQHPYAAGLYIPKELKEYVYLKTTSPLDKISFPVGEQTVMFFRNNLPLIFKEVIEVDTKSPSQAVKIVIEPSIVKFDPVIPFPAYNPYIATMVYRVDVFDQKGEKIFSQTATGDAQKSEGLMSGFSARRIMAEVVQEAMGKAVMQILEALSEAEELK